MLFYNRALSCLVPIELKIGKFKPEHIGQINFYLEALDRDVKKPNENPSVGVILCAGKEDAVVEYALSRSMSPTLVADYMNWSDNIERSAINKGLSHNNQQGTFLQEGHTVRV